MTNKPIEFDLIADDPSQYRSLAESEWVTIRGKRNRIAIGNPACQREQPTAIESGESNHVSSIYANADLYRISFALTLLPDVACEFVNVDVVLELQSGAPVGNFPSFIQLKPKEERATRAIKLTSSDKGKLSIGDKLLKIATVEFDRETELESQFERVDVRLASFGAGTRSAGWRMKLIKSQDIPLETEDLHALVAVSEGVTGQIRFRVAAQINIRTATDRVLSRLFLRQPPPGTIGDYTFPSG